MHMAKPEFLFSKDALIPVLAFGAVVLASNILVQYPVQHFGLSQMLTYGAFSYPFAFLITDATNRHFGASRTRQIVAVGFVIAVILSLIFATPRIALASGIAFLIANLTDVQIFDRLRNRSWWWPPLASSLVSSLLDTALFFSIAFVGIADMSVSVPVFGMDVPLWVSLGIFDYLVKLAMAALMIVPYGALLPWTKPVTQ